MESKSGRDFDLYLINEDGTGLAKVTTNPSFDSFPMFSPNGKYIAFASKPPRDQGPRARHQHLRGRMGRTEREMKPTAVEFITLGAGCFWCVEAVLQQLDGVTSLESGYMGGSIDNPSYDDVCSGTTGHAEVVHVGFDPAKITHKELLKWFFKLHDPTTLKLPGQRSGHAVPVGHLLPLARTEGGRGAGQETDRRRRGLPRSSRHRDLSGGEVLQGQHAPPELLPTEQEPGLLPRDHLAQAGKARAREVASRVNPGRAAVAARPAPACRGHRAAARRCDRRARARSRSHRHH